MVSRFFFSWSAESVPDPGSTTRDNQDNWSGDPPNDFTTTETPQDTTEQAYEDTTHSPAMDEEGGKTDT